MIELSEEHFKVMHAVRDGATIWGYYEAMKLREVQNFNQELITIVGIADLERIIGLEFDGAKRMPYFGAILTRKGKEFLELKNSPVL